MAESKGRYVEIEFPCFVYHRIPVDEVTRDYDKTWEENLLDYIAQAVSDVTNEGVADPKMYRVSMVSVEYKDINFGTYEPPDHQEHHLRRLVGDIEKVDSEWDGRRVISELRRNGKVIARGYSQDD